MVTKYEEYITVKAIKQFLTIWIVTEANISKVKNQTVGRYLCIPSIYKLSVMLLYILKRPVAETQDIGMVKMSI